MRLRLAVQRSSAVRGLPRPASIEEKPHTTSPDVPFGSALAVMHEKGFRHMPVIENGKPVGIVTARSAMDPELEDFAAEALRREHYRAQHV